MIVSFARVELRASHSKSLKDKRRVVRSIRGKVKSRFEIRVAEVGDGQNSWQSIELGFALVGNDRTFLAALTEQIVRFVETEANDNHGTEVVAVFRDSLFYGDDSAFNQLGGETT